MSVLNLQNFIYDKENHSKLDNHKILAPYNFHKSLPGNRARDVLIKALNIWFNIPEEKVLQCQDLLDRLHSAANVLDDMEDASDIRRSLPAAHLIYGVRSVFSSARMAIILQLRDSLHSKNPDVFVITLKYTMEMHRGQSKDVSWRDDFICPTEKKYMQMAVEKTSLTVLASDFVRLWSDSEIDATKFTRTLSLFVQIRNDYLNLCSDKYSAGKCFCSDIGEGQFSFPIVHAIQSRPNDTRITDILKQRTKDEATKRYCLSLMEEFGSMDYTYQVLMEMKDEMFKELQKFPHNKMLVFLLEEALKIE